MNRIKKIIFLMTAASTIGTSFAGVLSAQEYYYNDGYAYEGSRRASSVAPLVVLGTITAATVIAVLVTNGDNHSHYKGHHHHSHGH